ncbi:urate oxidase [Demequina sp. SYSU T00039]|uniref:Uricase n=1 Tax=Demequina lignilytica TaxID=3051663 RepID=A0AAW7M6E6_9MICO|nr:MULTISPECIES: urate oxidase [unclassified Demequina]MDN4478814.1 urate oxidase [Demequina sp. SYSU T00039-1]MDN4488912.1 urate oxidase [Demequina sp. SYSU T00039]
MAIILGDHQYGKAENRIVRIVRDTPRHEIRDVNVSTCLRGRFDAAHLTGDQGEVLPTDTQKQTSYAYAKTVGLASLERYAHALAVHFVDDVEPVDQARVELEEFAWERVSVGGAEHDFSWVRSGREVRTVAVTVDADGSAWITGGLKDLVVLKSSGSEFHGFLEDEYTVLEPTSDRIMATSLVAKWRFGAVDVATFDFDAAYAAITTAMVETFASFHSLALQQTLFQMGKTAIEAVPELVEVRLSAPNKHHFAYDLARFGIENHNEVFHADDRPYGLIQASVTVEGAPDAGPAWDQYSGLV